MKEIKTKDLFLADLRVYEKGNGAIIDDEMPKVFIRKKGNSYCNVFYEEEVYPFFKRLPYANTDDNGESYGTKLIPVNVDKLDEIGICAIECSNYLIDKIKEEEYITIEDLTEIVIKSKSYYFKDRSRIIEDNYTAELKKLRKDIPTHSDSESFLRIYRPSKRILMNTRINNIRRFIKEGHIENKYSKLFAIAAEDLDRNEYFNSEKEKVKQKVR